MTRPRGIIFDLDGTLCDTRIDLANAVNHARAALGFAPLSVEEVSGYVGDGLALMLERSFHGRADLVEPARPRFLEHYAEHLVDNSPLYEGVAEGVEALASMGASMAVLTNKPEPFARAIVEHYHLGRRFRCVFGGDSFPTRKPDPAGALAIVEAFGLSPAQVLMVGDNHTDLITARRAGMPSVFCAYGFGSQQGSSYDFIARRFADVAEIFRRGSAPPAHP